MSKELSINSMGMLSAENLPVALMLSLSKHEGAWHERLRVTLALRPVQDEGEVEVAVC